MATRKSFEVAIVGGGPAGLLAAILVAKTGVKTICLAPRPKSIDRRTSALMRGSLDILSDANVLETLLSLSATLDVIRIIDNTSHVFRGPQVEFDSAEIGGDPFARNFHNTDLVKVFHEKARSIKNLTICDDAVVDIHPEDDCVKLDTESGLTVSVKLVVGADGRMSPCRKAAGISAKISKLPQSALVFNVEHSRPHENVSTEFHRNAGPLTLVPLPGDNSSVVWVETHDEAARLNKLDTDDFKDFLSDQSFGVLGKISETSPRAIFPLSNLSVSNVGRGRIALVGEAAHVVPPIGAQGLNLGIRDAATIADLVSKATKSGTDLKQCVDEYSRSRRRDIVTRSGFVNLLNRSLLSDLVPVQILRSSGLAALAKIAPLRKIAMKTGIGPQV